MDQEIRYREMIAILSRYLPLDRILDLPIDARPHGVMSSLGEWVEEAEQRNDDDECRRILGAVGDVLESNAVRFRGDVASFLDAWSPHPDSPWRRRLNAAVAALLAEEERVPEDIAPLLPRQPRVALRVQRYEYLAVPLLRAFRFLIDREGFQIVRIGSFGGDIGTRWERGRHQLRLGTERDSNSIVCRWIYWDPPNPEIFDPIERAGVRRARTRQTPWDPSRGCYELQERRKIQRYIAFVRRAARRIEKHCGAWIEELESRTAPTN